MTAFRWTSSPAAATIRDVKALSVTLVVAALAGCTTSQQSLVEYIWTRTPGVVFVVVHPQAEMGKAYPQNADSSGKPVDPRAQYLLLCDARSADGMHCEVATEQAIRRYSFAPNTVPTVQAIDLPVGSIPDRPAIIEREEPKESSPPAPPPAPPPPPPPPPPAPAGKK